MVKYLEGKCTAEETELLQKDTAIWQELQAMVRVDALLSQQPMLNVRPAFQSQLKNTLIQVKSEPTGSWKDFILPGVFAVFSIVYAIFNMDTASTQVSWFEMPEIPSYTVLSLVCICILGFVALDQLLQRKTNRSFHLMFLQF